MSEDYEAIRKRRNARAIRAMQEALSHVSTYATVPGEAIAYYVDAARSVRGFRWGGSGSMQTFFKAAVSPHPLLIRGKEYVLDHKTLALHRKDEPSYSHNIPRDVLTIPFTPNATRVTVREDPFIEKGRERAREFEWRARRQMLMFNLPPGFSLLDTPEKTYGYQVVQHQTQYKLTLLMARKRVDSGQLYIASKEMVLAGEVGFPAGSCYVEFPHCRAYLAYDNKTLYLPGSHADTFFTMASKRSVDIAEFHRLKSERDPEVPGLLATYRVAYDNSVVVLTSHPAGSGADGRTVTLPVIGGKVEIAGHHYVLVRNHEGAPTLKLVATSSAADGQSLV